MRAPQLHLDVVGVILVDIENDEPFRPLCRRLTAELAADAAAAARDEHGLAGDVGRDLIEVDLHVSRPSRSSMSTSRICSMRTSPLASWQMPGSVRRVQDVLWQ